jgi:hypothetical protein
MGKDKEPSNRRTDKNALGSDVWEIKNDSEIRALHATPLHVGCAKVKNRYIKNKVYICGINY